MRLWIMRHGEAEPLRGDNDALRGLTPHGHTQAMATAAWLQRQVSGPLRIVVSPYRRARQTAEAVADVVSAVMVEQQDLLMPEGDPRSVTAWLARQEDAELLLVSHMPLVSQLTGWLCDGVLAGPSFHVAQVCLLELEQPGASQAQRRTVFIPD